MQLTVKTGKATEVSAGMLAVPLVQREPSQTGLPRNLAELDRRLGGVIAAILKSGDFRGRAEETALLHPTEGGRIARVLLVGLGPEKTLGIEQLRNAAGQSVQRATAKGVRTLAFLAPGSRRLKPAQAAAALAEGAILADYRFDTYRSKPKDAPAPLRSLSLVYEKLTGAAEVRAAVRRAMTIAEGQNLARQLSNEPANELPPATLARRAQRMARKVGLRSKVFREAELKKLGMGGILAVGQGSANPPRLIILEHLGRSKGKRKAAPALCFVGKGITFDSGGISIKPSAGMEEMKHDMSGAATVIGAMQAIGKLGLPIDVVGIVAAAENMPSATAYRPGDIIRTYAGKTIEVLNTDAEGRIVLADALDYGRRMKPQAMADFATLTGAMMIALGGAATGVFGNNEHFTNAVHRAGEATGETTWPMPLFEEHKKAMKSAVADLRNTGGRTGGASTAAAFLSEFAQDTPWAHLDIAGTGWTDKPRPYQPVGATGVGVRLMVELARSWDPKRDT